MAREGSIDVLHVRLLDPSSTLNVAGTLFDSPSRWSVQLWTAGRGTSYPPWGSPGGAPPGPGGLGRPVPTLTIFTWKYTPFRRIAFTVVGTEKGQGPILTYDGWV